MAGKILAWIKGHLIIVISCVLIVTLPAAGWFFSSSWNGSIKESAESAYRKESGEINRVSRVDYALPAVLQGEENITESRAPNPVVTEFYARQRAQREEQVAAVVQRGRAFNERGHTVPVRGLLPQAEDDRELRRLGRILGERVAGDEEAGTPSLYATLLRRLNAGDAPDAEALSDRLDQFRQQQERALAASSPDGNLSDEQIDQIQRELVARRLGEYAGRAESLGFYCALSAIQSEEPVPGYSHVPSEPPSLNSITPGSVYTWVWDSWIITDVLEAVALANTDDAGVSLPVPDAPVKRVEFIGVERLEFPEQSASDAAPVNPTRFTGRDPGRGARSARGAAPAADPAIPIEGGEPSFTGRVGNRAGAAYDIRHVDLVIVASSEHLPRFIDALGRTNYMTVVDLDLESVDTLEALRQGYFFGDDHVVRASMRIETVWLRSWTTPLMPESVKRALGVPIQTPPQGDG